MGNSDNSWLDKPTDEHKQLYDKLIPAALQTILKMDPEGLLTHNNSAAISIRVSNLICDLIQERENVFNPPKLEEE